MTASVEKWPLLQIVLILHRHWFATRFSADCSMHHTNFNQPHRLHQSSAKQRQPSHTVHSAHGRSPLLPEVLCPVDQSLWRTSGQSDALSTSHWPSTDDECNRRTQTYQTRAAACTGCNAIVPAFQDNVCSIPNNIMTWHDSSPGAALLAGRRFARWRRPQTAATPAPASGWCAR